MRVMDGGSSNYPTCDCSGLRLLLRQDGVTQIAKILQTALNIHVGCQPGDDTRLCELGRRCQPGSSNYPKEEHSRPLREETLVSNPALVIGADGVIDVRTPWHIWEDFK